MRKLAICYKQKNTILQPGKHWCPSRMGIHKLNANFYKLFLDLSEFHTVKIYIEGKMKYYNAFS